MISSNTTNNHTSKEKIHGFSVEREINAIREGRVPSMPIASVLGVDRWYFSHACISSIIDTFIQEDNKSFESLAALLAYIHTMLSACYYLSLSDEHVRYILIRCEEDLSNTCVVVCILSLQLNSWFVKENRIHDFLVRLTLYHHKNHTCWASSLAVMWNELIQYKPYRETFVTLICESSCFASAFADLLECRIETKYSYWSDVPEFVLFYPNESEPEKYCFEILRYIFFELDDNIQHIQIHNMLKRYIPYVYDEEGNVQSYSAAIQNLENETKTKSANKR
jgi:hypothetical protein